MSLGPLGNAIGLSGAQNDAASQLRKAQGEQKAQRAEGLGATDADSETSDRDADGRRLWEDMKKNTQQQAEENATDHDPLREPPVSKDPTGASGNVLDLQG